MTAFDTVRCLVFRFLSSLKAAYLGKIGRKLAARGSGFIFESISPNHFGGRVVGPLERAALALFMVRRMTLNVYVDAFNSMNRQRAREPDDSEAGSSCILLSPPPARE